MHRAVLEACIPLLIAMAIGFVLLWAVAKISRGKFDFSKLRRLHRCQHGGVQSLSLVLTLPLFIMIVMFIIQVSQLMIGVMVVNYSAFATARSAVVWVPARTGAGEQDENMLPERIWNEDYPDRTLARQTIESRPLFITQDNADDSLKFRRVFSAAVLACAPISPSRDLGFQSDDRNLVDSARRFYQSFDPEYEQNGRIPIRIANKLGYAANNTRVRLRFLEWDTDRERYPTYNALDPYDNDPPPDGDGIIDGYGFERNEADWQNAIEVTVFHEFAMLPGPGRFLARHIVRADGQEDRTAERIESAGAPNGGALYTTLISATATMTNEGFKSILPYEQTPY